MPAVFLTIKVMEGKKRRMKSDLIIEKKRSHDMNIIKITEEIYLHLAIKYLYEKSISLQDLLLIIN